MTWLHRIWRLFRNATALLGALVLLVTALPPRGYVNWLSGNWPAPHGGGVLIVLGGDSNDVGILGETSYLRALYAVITWRQETFAKVVLSGNPPIVAPMRDFLISQGVPANAIILETESENTRDNAVHSSQIAHALPGPYVLLTSDFHMYRAHRAFTRAGLRVEPRPFPDALKRFTNWRWRVVVTIELVEETAKIAYYQARGWI
jgi:uncharacterized SAM-binding protein YcdF (DUF218 family)